jgi:glycerol uptake facilitator protein
MAEPSRPTLVGELLAEFLGTLVLIALGDGVVAMVALLHKGSYASITLGWGLAVTLGACVAGRVSGAHLNPALTLALAVFRGFPWRKVLPYTVAQVAGAFAGAALVYVNYLPAFRHPDPDVNLVGIFATFPMFPEEWQFGLIDQVVGTALLVGLVFAITDPKNQPVAAALNPVMVGLVVVAIGVSWGGMHGYAINPARDLGPRLFTLVAGFRDTGFGTHAAWVPVVGPLVGGLLGALVYEWLVRPFLPAAGPSPG